MLENIVSDTSCLILLDKIGLLYLLKTLFGQIIATSIIASEYGNALPDFVTIEDPKNKIYQNFLERNLDSGEASAIALALEKEHCLLIIDESKGRCEAFKLNLNFTGTIGILILAKEKGLIDSISIILDKIYHTDFRISEDLIQEAKQKCNE